MIHFDLPKEKSSIIKVVGVGGGGSNAVNYMYSLNGSRCSKPVAMSVMPMFAPRLLS